MYLSSVRVMLDSDLVSLEPYFTGIVCTAMTRDP
jgi:hypothetical protein